MGLSYCPRCGKLFSRGIRDVCNSCTQNIEKEYEVCVAYLKEHRGATIHEVSEATEVSVKQITKFVREGRISTANMPNMNIPCEVCGLPIREGIMCESCRGKLQRDVRNLKPGSSNATGPSVSSDPKKSNSFQIRGHH